MVTKNVRFCSTRGASKKCSKINGRIFQKKTGQKRTFLFHLLPPEFREKSGKKAPPLPAVFPNALKGRKGEKEMGILNLVGVQSPEERECRRESGISGPHRHLSAWSPGFIPLTNRNIIQPKPFVKCFCQKFFCVKLNPLIS